MIPNRPRRRPAGLAGEVRRAASLAVAILVLAAPPALAHGLDGAEPSNYRTRITAVSGLPEGVEIEVVEAGNRLELTNDTVEEVVVPGYDEEPYLRVGPEGVFENLNSPATYRNRSRFPTAELPARADEDAAPEWRKVSDSTTVRWHDHRTHWMGEQPPGPVQQAPGRTHVIIPTWEIPLRHGGELVSVQGDLTWVPGPSPWPWLALAAAAAVGLVLLTRGRAAGRAMVAALAVLVAFDALRLAGLAGDSERSFLEAIGANPPAIAAWAAAALAAWRLLAGDARLGLPLAAAAGALFSVISLSDLGDLSSSQLPTANPYWLARLAVAVGLGVGAGVVVAAATTLSSAPATAPGARPVQTPAEDEHAPA